MCLHLNRLSQFFSIVGVSIMNDSDITISDKRNYEIILTGCRKNISRRTALWIWPPLWALNIDGRRIPWPAVAWEFRYQNIQLDSNARGNTKTRRRDLLRPALRSCLRLSQRRRIVLCGTWIPRFAEGMILVKISNVAKGHLFKYLYFNFS